MTESNIIKNHLIVNDEYEIDLITRILKRMNKDIFSIYNAVKRESHDAVEEIINTTAGIIKNIDEYVGGVDDSNTSKILLFLNKLPIIANEICQEVEEEQENLNGVNVLIARDNVNKYMKKIFLAGYDRLYKFQGKEQVATYLYYECEKFIDAMVLEFKEDISQMIDENNLVYDDLYYVRRLVKNKENANDNTIPIPCVGCDTNCKRCKHFPDKEQHQAHTDKYRKLSKILDERLETGAVSEEIRTLNDRDHLERLVKKVVLIEKPENGGHKPIQFKCNPKIFSIISAERFDKILRRRYNLKDYKKDRDIYYILHHGIDVSMFTGDKLLSNIETIHDAYIQSESEGQK